MTIRVRVANDQEISTKQDREVTRERNEHGIFKRLMCELETTAKQYGRDIDDVLKLFEEVNCSKAALKKALEGSEYVKWTELEDMALHNEKDDQIEYLLRTKGQEEVEKRRNFLGLTQK